MRMNQTLLCNILWIVAHDAVSRLSHHSRKFKLYFCLWPNCTIDFVGRNRFRDQNCICWWWEITFKILHFFYLQIIFLKVEMSTRWGKGREYSLDLFPGSSYTLFHPCPPYWSPVPILAGSHEFMWRPASIKLSKKAAFSLHNLLFNNEKKTCIFLTVFCKKIIAHKFLRTHFFLLISPKKQNIYVFSAHIIIIYILGQIVDA